MRFGGLIMLLVLAAGDGHCNDVSDTPPAQLNEAIVAYAGGDDLKAARLLLPFAEGDVAVAQLLLARLYLHSPLLPRDCDLGTQWLTRSMHNGSGEAAYDMGQLFLRGHCVSRSGAGALNAFLHADALGYPAAPTALGELYLGSHDISFDRSAAIQWFKKGASMFDSDSCYQLGLLNSGREDVAPNYHEAYIWFDISANFAFSSSDQYERALGHRDSVRERLTPWELHSAATEARRMLGEFVANNRRRRFAGEP